MEFNISNRIISVAKKENQLSYNSDYIVNFRFDEEWDNTIKTARFIQFGKHIDVVLDKNDSCKLPAFKNGWVIVGVFNDAMTTTYTKIYINRTVKDENSDQAEEPAPDVYNQIIKLISDGMVKGEPGKSAYQIALDNGFAGTETEWLASLKGQRGPKGDTGDDGHTPQKGVDYFTAEDISSITNNLSLGTHTDGLVYIFNNGQPIGSGVEMTGGGGVPFKLLNLEFQEGVSVIDETTTTEG